MISVGEKLPEASLKRVNGDSSDNITTSDYFAAKTVVLFGVPGAFTPTCSNNHLPGFLENREAILGKGVDAIAVLAVNDHHVMRAWARFSGGEGQIDFLADGNGEFVRAAGLEADMSGGGLGMRARRFSMIVKDGRVEQLNLEEKAGSTEATGAARIMQQL